MSLLDGRASHISGSRRNTFYCHLAYIWKRPKRQESDITPITADTSGPLFLGKFTQKNFWKRFLITTFLGVYSLEGKIWGQPYDESERWSRNFCLLRCDGSFGEQVSLIGADDETQRLSSCIVTKPNLEGKVDQRVVAGDRDHLCGDLLAAKIY